MSPVSIVIPHYLGNVLRRCVGSIVEHLEEEVVEVIVADDQPRDDGSIGGAQALLPRLRVVKVGGGRGFGAAANAGVRAAKHELVFLLNNDAVVTAGWLKPLLTAAREHPQAAGFQPKVRSLQDPSRFDYGGAAGGMIDPLGYPYALGRRYGRIEFDQGRYDTPRKIHWAVGGAMLLRRSAALAVGLFDEAFYMHMEEIDLCWRLRRAGHEIRSVPQSVVLHEGGHTLRSGSWRKTWLNHRNNWTLLIKNLRPVPLVLLLAMRALLVFPTMAYGLLSTKVNHAVAAPLALLWSVVHVRSLAERRADARRAIEKAAALEHGAVSWPCRSSSSHPVGDGER